VTRHSTPKEWQKRYGAARRAIDRALLEEAERRIASLPSIEDDIREAVVREFAYRAEHLTTSSMNVLGSAK
jgi:hypothetical protein